MRLAEGQTHSACSKLSTSAPLVPMETKPTAFHSLDEWVSESQISAAATIYNPTATDKMAPTAEPEGEDIDIEVSPEIKKPGRSGTEVASSLRAHTAKGSLSDVNSTEIERSLCEDEFPPPPLDFSDFSIEEVSDQDFSTEMIEWVSHHLPNPVHDHQYEENISANIVPSLPFADESDEDAEADIITLDKRDVSEFALSAVDDLEQQGDLPPVRDIHAPAVSTFSSEFTDITFASESNADEEAYVNSMHNLDKWNESESTALTHVSDVPAGPECCGDVGECEDTVEPNAFKDELHEASSTEFSPLFAGNKVEEAFVDSLHNSDHESFGSESFLSTSLAVSQEQGEALSQYELPPMRDIQPAPDYSCDVCSVEAGESEDTTEETFLAEGHFNTELSVLSLKNDEEVYVSSVSESISTFAPVEAVSGEQKELFLEAVSCFQSTQECSDVFDVEFEDSKDTMKPIVLTHDLTNVTLIEGPSNCDEHMTYDIFPFLANGSNKDEEAYNNTLHSSDLAVSQASHALDVFLQQGELSLQNEMPPLGVNQEATQQVLNQASPLLSPVSIEPANPPAPHEGSGAVISESRVGHSAVRGETRLISAGERQFTESKTVRPIKEVLKSVQEQKSKKPGHISFQRRAMESDSCDESDSGVSADFSPGSTLESSSSSANVHKETPIEREIRRAIEREHSLRRSRGLPNPPTSPEYVEIPLRKAVLYPSLPPTKVEICQGKDRQFAGKKMQRDIYEEAQREQDLVKLGKIPGFYDKGTVRQLKERKLLFEAFQKPNDSCSVKSNVISSSNSISFSEKDSLNHKVKGTRSDIKNELTSSSPKVFPEAKSSHIIIIENNLDLPAIQPSTNIGTITVVDSAIDKTRKVQEEKDVYLTPRENPFFKLRSSTSVVKVEQDIREAQERERELRKQRINVYGTRVERGGGRPAGTEEQSSTLSSVKALPVQDLPDSGPSTTATTTTLPAAHHSSGRIGVWPPALAEKNHQTEVHHCPRTPRLKNPLVQRWESGLINAQED